jgi:hypothetical protein
LVYGHAWLHDCLAFADADTALSEATEIMAIATAATWRAATNIETHHVFNPVVEQVAEDPDRDLDEPFNIFDAYGVADGDWPGMVTARALSLLPKDLQDRYGTIVDTNFNGPYLEVPLTNEAGLIAALEERGYQMRRDDNLINLLDGRGFNPMSEGLEIVWPL